MSADITGLIKKLYLGKYQDLIAKTQNQHSPEIDQLTTNKTDFDAKQSYDVIFVHAYTTDDMNQHLKSFWKSGNLKLGGMVYFIYPKLNNPYYPGIHRDEIFPALGVDDGLGLYPGTHYKFNRMVSLNDVFTMMGVKYLTPKEIDKLQKPQDQAGSSGRVADYIQYIPEISQGLSQINPDLQSLFNQLTPGKQRQWAREIYSARTQATKDKRWDKLIQELQK